MMSHIHVCLVSDQPIPNLTTVLQFRPDTVILLTTRDMRRQAKRLEAVLKSKNFGVKIQEIKPYDINNVIAVSEAIINECRQCELSLNITGGTKVGTLGSFQAFYNADKLIYYVNTRDHEILQLFPDKEQRRVPIEVAISIKDYLAAYGFKVKEWADPDDYIYSRKELTEHLAHLAANGPGLIGQINYQLQDYEKKTYPIKLALDEKNIPKKVWESIVGTGLGRRMKSGSFEITSLSAARYLAGIWFEEYIYMLAKTVGADEVRLEVKGEWDEYGDNAPENEFDVLLAKGNRLFLISCKTSNPDRSKDISGESVGKDYLYELDSLSHKALGLFGKRMLASARPINNEYVKKRASVLDIKIIDGKNIATLKENLRQWLSK